MQQPIPQTIFPADLNPNIAPEDFIFKIIQTASVCTPKPGEEQKDRFSWELHLEALPNKSLEDIESVKYTLHPTVKNPERKVLSRGNGFQVKSSGWGVYPVKMEINLHSGKKITGFHLINGPKPEDMM